MRYANNKATIRNYSYSFFTHLLKLDIWTMDYKLARIGHLDFWTLDVLVIFIFTNGKNTYI